MQVQDTRHDSLSLTFAALADPTRRAILTKLRAGEATVTLLAEPFSLSLPAITKHLKVLERAGLVRRRHDSRWRPSRLDAGPLKEASEWLGQYREFWEARFDRLGEYLDEIQKEEMERKENNHE